MWRTTFKGQDQINKRIDCTLLRAIANKMMVAIGACVSMEMEELNGWVDCVRFEF